MSDGELRGSTVKFPAISNNSAGVGCGSWRNIVTKDADSFSERELCCLQSANLLIFLTIARGQEARASLCWARHSVSVQAGGIRSQCKRRGGL